MLSEKQLVEHLEQFLRDELAFQTYSELQVCSNGDLKISEKISQEQFRIDLAGVSQIDSSIYFFEAETQIHVNHPTIYKHFCDYCYLLCPDEQFELLNSNDLEKQLSWAREEGIGIITIGKKGKIRSRVHAIQQPLDSKIRKGIIDRMNKRYKIPFSTVPLWNRSRELTEIVGEK
jgi:hypothetical protein